MSTDSARLTPPHWSNSPMIETISAITLATHDMTRAVRFYETLGFQVLHGGKDALFTSFQAGSGYLNLIAQSADRHRSWWGVQSSTFPTWTLSTPRSWLRGIGPRRSRATRNEGSGSST